MKSGSEVPPVPADGTEAADIFGREQDPAVAGGGGDWIDPPHRHGYTGGTNQELKTRHLEEGQELKQWLPGTFFVFVLRGMVTWNWNCRHSWAPAGSPRQADAAAA